MKFRLMIFMKSKEHPPLLSGLGRRIYPQAEAFLLLRYDASLS